MALTPEMVREAAERLRENTVTPSRPLEYFVPEWVIAEGRKHGYIIEKEGRDWFIGAPATLEDGFLVPGAPPGFVNASIPVPNQ